MVQYIHLSPSFRHTRAALTKTTVSSQCLKKLLVRAIGRRDIPACSGRFPLPEATVYLVHLVLGGHKHPVIYANDNEGAHATEPDGFGRGL